MSGSMSSWSSVLRSRALHSVQMRPFKREFPRNAPKLRCSQCSSRPEDEGSRCSELASLHHALTESVCVAIVHAAAAKLEAWRPAEWSAQPLPADWVPPVRRQEPAQRLKARCSGLTATDSFATIK